MPKLKNLLLFLTLASACTHSEKEPKHVFAAGHYALAGRLWEARAGQGDPVAQNALGVLYFCGLGVKRDPAAAVNWFGKAALQHNADAQRNLGMMFELGLSIPRDNARAIGWYLEARRNGNRRATLALQALGSEVTTNQAQQGMSIVAADIAQKQVSTR